MDASSGLSGVFGAAQYAADDVTSGGGMADEAAGAKDAALGDLIEEARALGANAVVGIDLDYETVGESMLMVSANGTAVRVE